MKQTVLDVLLYLFERCAEEDVDIVADRDSLHGELQSAGFEQAQVDKAFDWLQALASQREEDGDDVAATSRGAFRVFAAEESARLDVECRGFLMFLEQSGVLDATSRELVLDRAMALEADEIDLDQLKWVVLMVLLNLPGQDESSFTWMEDLVMDEPGRCLH